jgi:hypothetical protein
MEKTLFAQTGEIKGKKPQGYQTFNFQYTPEEETLRQMRGTLFFLVGIKGVSEVKAGASARQIFTSFKEKFYSAAGSNLKVLEEALDLAREFIKQGGMQVDLVAANLWGSVLYIAKLVEAGAILARSGTAKKIEVTKAASGTLGDKDNVFLHDPLFLKNTDLASLGEQSSYEDFPGSLKAIQEIIGDREGSAFGVRLTIQEPVEVAKQPLVADLDKAGKKEKTSAHEKGEYEVGEKTRLKLPKLNIKFGPLEGKSEVAKKLSKKAWLQAREYFRKASFFILSPWLPRAPGSLEEATLKKRQRVVQIAVMLVAILVISIGVNLISHTRRVNREKFQESITLVESKLKDAKNLKDINPTQARSYIDEAEEELAKLSDKDPKVIKLKETLETLLARINKIFKVSLKEVVDLSTMKGGIDTKELKLAQDMLFVLDAGTSSVYKVDIARGDSSIFVSEKKGLQNIAPLDGFIYLQTSEGIYKIDSQTKTQVKSADSSSDWKSLIAAGSYRSNLYLLDKEAKQIWKHLPTGTGLGAPRSYFSEEFKATPVSFSVDGAVWVVSKNQIFKFFAGKKDKFKVNDSPKKFSRIVDVYTSEALANLYILDRGESGVFVVEKGSGAYAGFYTAGELTGAEALVANEAKKTVYVLSNDAISSFKLK